MNTNFNCTLEANEKSLDFSASRASLIVVEKQFSYFTATSGIGKRQKEVWVWSAKMNHCPGWVSLTAFSTSRMSWGCRSGFLPHFSRLRRKGKISNVRNCVTIIKEGTDALKTGFSVLLVYSERPLSPCILQSQPFRSSSPSLMTRGI